MTCVKVFKSMSYFKQMKPGRYIFEPMWFVETGLIDCRICRSHEFLRKEQQSNPMQSDQRAINNK